MAAPPSSPAVQAVLEALDALYKSNDRAAMEQANTWLQDFQKTVSALAKRFSWVATRLPLTSSLAMPYNSPMRGTQQMCYFWHRISPSNLAFLPPRRFA